MASRSESTLSGTTGEAGGTPEDNCTASHGLRAVPVLFALLLAAVVALAVSPALRHELAQSFVRHDQHYVELYLTDEVEARTCPLTDDGLLRLDAAVRSHLADAERIDWVARAEPDDGSPAATVRGTVDTRPGTTSRIRARLMTPATSYTASLRLVGRAETLSLHC